MTVLGYSYDLSKNNLYLRTSYLGYLHKYDRVLKEPGRSNSKPSEKRCYLQEKLPEINTLTYRNSPFGIKHMLNESLEEEYIINKEIKML